MRFTRLALAASASFLLVVAGVSVPAQAADAEVHTTTNAVPGQYVVVLKSTAPASTSAAKVAGKNKVVTKFSHALNGFVVKASAKEAKRMANDSRVKGVYQDGVVHATDAGVTVNQPIPAPPDTYWGLDRIDQRTLPFNPTGNYTWVYSGAGVHVYIIDTGINATHSQFGGRAEFVFSATGIGSPGVDCHGHGTHVAGTIGGSTYGVAKNVLLRGVKVLNCAGSGSWSQVIEGIDYVTYHAAKPAVVNMSLGGGYYQPVNDAVTNSINSGITYAVAAGNSNADACTSSPSATPAAITVGATGNYADPNHPVDDTRASFSNYGTCLDIFAPGTYIRSSYIGSNTAAATLSGTSMASPHVAGVAALILQKQPTWTPAQVRNYMVGISTANVVGNAGPGSPNFLLYSGNIPGLSANAAPEPITCTRTISVAGNLNLQGRPVAGATVEVWYDRSGSTAPVFKGTATTNSSGNYSRAVSQSYDGYWYAIYRGAPLIGSKQSTSDYVNCSNR